PRPEWSQPVAGFRCSGKCGALDEQRYGDEELRQAYRQPRPEPGQPARGFRIYLQPLGRKHRRRFFGHPKHVQSVAECLRSGCDWNMHLCAPQNMLGSGFNVIGIGRAYGASSTYGWYWTTDFGGVVDQTISPTPNPTPAPAISSFSASPSSI